VSVGVAVVGGVTASASIGVSGSKSSGSSSETTQVNSSVTAGGTLALTSGRDASLKGAVAQGKDVIASVGRDLNVVSVQDEASRKSTSAGFSAGLTLSPGVGLGANGGVNVGKGSGSSSIVSEQTALLAREGSLGATVKGNTDIKGGVIAAVDGSGADSGRLSLTTGTLSASDIKDSAKSKDVSVGVSASINNVTDRNTRSANLPVVDGSFASSTFKQDTKATIGQGTITVGVPGENVTVNRDIDQSQIVTKDKQTGFTVNVDVAAAKELVSLVKGVAGDKDAAKNSIILQGVAEIKKDIDGDDTTRSDTAQDIKNAVTDVRARRQKADADREQAAVVSGGDQDKIIEATEARLTKATEAETLRLEQRTVDARLDALDPSLSREERAAAAVVIKKEVSDSLRSEASQANIRRQVIVRDTFVADKRVSGGGRHSAVDAARLDAAPTATTGEPKKEDEILVLGFRDDAARVKGAKLGLIEETAQAVGVVTKFGGGTVQGVGTGTINNAKDTLGLLSDAGGKLINLATFGTTNKAEAKRTDARIDGAIALGKAAVNDPVGTAKKLGESFTKPFTEGAQKLADGKTFDGTAQITEAASDTILNAATGGGKAVLAIVLKGGKGPDINPKAPPKPPTLKEHKAHHDNHVGDTQKYLESQGFTVETEVSFAICGIKGSCRTDILAKGPDGKYVVFEIKTGDADLSVRQSAIYPLIESGDARPTGKIARELGLDPKKPLRDQGYPNGIPVVVQGFPGLGK
jgi:hypothetical protein